MPENQGADAPSVEEVVTPDPMAERFKNQSHEFSRKLENATKPLEDKINALLNKLTPTAPKQEEADLDSLLYSDPKAYARAVAAQAKQEAVAEVGRSNEMENRKNAVLGQLVTSFPELRDQSSELAKAATAEYASLPDHIKADPLAYEIAVNRAAIKQGSKPMSQRNDEFTLGSNTGSKPRAPKKDAEMDAVLEVAALFGKDVSDPAYVKTLKAHSKRDFYKYREPKPGKAE